MHETLANNNHVAARYQRAGCGQPHAFDFLIDAGVLLNKGVCLGDVSFRLVVIKIADEIFDRVPGEKAFEFCIQLCRQRLVVGYDQSGSIDFGNHIGNSIRLAGPVTPKQHLVVLTS